MRTMGIREKMIRKPAVAGTFYPASPERLRAMLRAFLDEASVPQLANVRAVIAPHAGYIYSGPIAAHAYKVWENTPQRPHTIYLMGPAHYEYVSGIALTRAGAFATPLGTVPVAEEIVDVLLDHGRPFLVSESAHAPEHCLEVQLPFLQVVFGNHFRIVPMLFGQVNPLEVVPTLVDLLRADPNALVVVSSDLSHYHDYWTARRLDTATIEAIVQGDMERARQGEACGILPILTLMGVAGRMGWMPHLLDYRNSGDTAGDKSRVVGYAAIAYTA